MAYKVVNGKVINNKKKVELTFIAIRHTEDGGEEMCSARAEAAVEFQFQLQQMTRRQLQSVERLR